MKKDKINDENIVLDEQQKEDEQSKKKMPKDKVKRIVLAVFLLLLAVAFVVLGAFCATGFIDDISAPANVAYADVIVDKSECFADFDINCRQFFGSERLGVTSEFNAFFIRDNFFSWFDDWGVPNCSRKSFLTFYRISDNRKVADLLVTRNGNYSGGLILRMFADDKLSSYSSFDMFSFSEVYDDEGQFAEMSVRTFMNTFCFGYSIDDTVYGMLNDDVVDEIWAIEFTEMMFICSDVTNQSKINQLQSSIDYWEINYNALRDNYNMLEDKYSALVKDYNYLQFDYDDLMIINYNLLSMDCLSYIPLSLSEIGVESLSRTTADFDSDNVVFFEVISSLDPIELTNDDVSKNVADFRLLNSTIDTFDSFSFISKLYDSDTYCGSWFYFDNGYHYLAIAPRDFDGGSFTILSYINVPDCCLDFEHYGYSGGYSDGYGYGYAYALSDGEIVTDGIIDVIESPIEFLKTVFNFEIFGINISSVIFFVISIVIVAFVIKKVV